MDDGSNDLLETKVNLCDKEEYEVKAALVADRVSFHKKDFMPRNEIASRKSELF